MLVLREAGAQVRRAIRFLIVCSASSLAVGCVAIMAVVNAISPKLLIILLCIAAGLLFSIFAGVPLWIGGGAGGAGGAVAIMSEPAPPPQSVTNINTEGGDAVVHAAAGPAGTNWIEIGFWAFVGWMAFKYLFPKSRAARNFWGGLVGLLRGGGRAALRKIGSANGTMHTRKPGG